MERRVLVLLCVAAAAAAVVGLSAAATLTRGDAREPATSRSPVSKTTVTIPASGTASVKTRELDEAPAVATSGPGQDLQRVEDYWTKEHMAEAQPREQIHPRASSPSPKGQSGPTVPGSKPSKSTPKGASNTTEGSGIETSPGTGGLDGPQDDPMPMEQTRPPLGTPAPDPGSGGSSAPGSPSP